MAVSLALPEAKVLSLKVKEAGSTGAADGAVLSVVVVAGVSVVDAIVAAVLAVVAELDSDSVVVGSKEAAGAGVGTTFLAFEIIKII
ncbi:unnamed protein product [[Candida] boidinii]|nr:unnamed protein product [[Candida] boidinii]